MKILIVEDEEMIARLLSQGPGLPEDSHVQKTILCTIFFICFHYFRLDLISKTLWSNDLTPVNMAHS